MRRPARVPRRHGRRREGSFGAFWAARCISGSARRARTMRPNAVAALLAVAALEGDVLNAAAALSNFNALKGRGERIDLQIAGKHIRLIDESYNANPSSMAARLAISGRRRRNGASPFWATCWSSARKARTLHAGLAERYRGRARRSRIFKRRADGGVVGENSSLPPRRCMARNPPILRMRSSMSFRMAMQCSSKVLSVARWPSSSKR